MTFKSTKPAIVYGSEFDFQMPQSLQAALTTAIDKYPNGEFIFVDEVEKTSKISYQEQLHNALNMLGQLQKLGCTKGHHVILDASSPQDFIPALWAVLLGGMTAVPLVPSQWNVKSHREFTERMHNTHLMLNRPLVISSNTQLFQANGCQPISFSQLKWKIKPGTPANSDTAQSAVMISTSGTTGKPQLVTLSGKAVMHRWWPAGPESPNKNVFLNWMPLDHVMGLGFASPNCQAKINLSAECFIKNPITWLTQIEKQKVTHAGMSNFGMRLINQAASGKTWCLGTIKKIGVGTEMISADICSAFIEMLIRNGAVDDAVILGYGLSECGPVAGGVRAYRPESIRRSNQPPLIDRPTSGHAIRVVDDFGNLLNETEVGEIQVAGPTMTNGYYNDIEANAFLFTADKWLRTGDVGYLQDGYLCVTGREKETISVNSEKYSCIEMDSAIQKISGILVAHVFNFFEPETQASKLGLVYVLDGNVSNKAQMESDMRRIFADTFGFGLNLCKEIKEHDLPRTRTGKLRRHQLVNLLNINSTKVNYSKPQQDATASVQNVIAKIMSRFLGGVVPKPKQDFFSLGGDSLGALMFLVAIEKELNINMPPAIFSQDPTVEAIIKFSGKQGGNLSSELRLVPVQKGHSEHILFITPGIWGKNAFASQFATEMGAQFSVWTFHVGSKHFKMQSITDFAKACCVLIKAAQPKGPYNLLGHSFGGLLAYEIACQLIFSGEKVNTISIIDAIAKLEQRDFGISKTKPANFLVENHRYISRLYLPKVANVSVSYFKAKDSVYYSHSDQASGWDYYAKQGVAVYDISGDHQSIVKGKSRQLVAKYVAENICGKIKITAPHSSIPEETRLFIDKALQATIDKDLRTEIYCLTKSINSYRDCPSWIYMRLAFALYDNRDIKSSVQVYIDAQKRDSWPLNSHYRFRNVLKLIRQSSLAKSVLEVVENVAIDSPATAHMVGAIFRALQDLTLATKSYESGLVLFPQSLELRVSLVETLIAQKSNAIAESQIKFALTLEQENDVTFFKLGHYALSLNNLELASQCFKKCIAIDPENTKAHANIEHIKKLKII